MGRCVNIACLESDVLAKVPDEAIKAKVVEVCLQHADSWSTPAELVDAEVVAALADVYALETTVTRCMGCPHNDLEQHYLERHHICMPYKIMKRVLIARLEQA